MSKSNRNLAKKQAAKAAKTEKKLQNRKLAMIVGGVMLVAVVAVLILSSLPHYAKIELTEQGTYRDRDTGIEYAAAPENYEPVSRSKRIYGKFDGRNFYPITGQDTKQWLAGDLYGIRSYVYYSTDIELPTLENFKTDTVHVCKDGDVVVQVAEIARDEHVAAILDAVLNGEPATITATDTVVYTLRLDSSVYTWLYYNIAYVVTPDGYYYHDRGTGRTIEADGLVEEYIKNAVQNGDKGSDTESESVSDSESVTESESVSDSGEDTP